MVSIGAAERAQSLRPNEISWQSCGGDTSTQTISSSPNVCGERASHKDCRAIAPCAVPSLRSPCTVPQHRANWDLPGEPGHATHETTAEMPCSNLVELEVRIPLPGHSILIQVKRSSDAQSSLVINRPSYEVSVALPTPMMIYPRASGYIAAAVLSLVAASMSDAEELARIPAHSQRYGTHIGISAYDDPLLKGVTCFVSGPHTDGDRRAAGVTTSVSCHRVGTLSTTARVPQQAQVFDESVDPVFRSIHIIRILDLRRLVVLYFSFTESDLAGDLPGHVDVVRLPVISGKNDAAGK